jgi:multiple sugar transport system permease protein
MNSVMRTVFFLPGSVTGPVLVLIFIFMLDPAVSPFGFMMRPFGLQVQQDVITNKTLVPVFALIRFFSSAGGWVAIFYGALNGISKEVLEAAEMDGCNSWQLAWHIKRPLIMTYVWYMVITLFVACMQLYAEPALISSAMYGDSPVTPYWSLNQLAAQITLLGADFGASGAISLLQVAISLIAAYLVITRTDFYRTDVTD